MFKFFQKTNKLFDFKKHNYFQICLTRCLKDSNRTEYTTNKTYVIQEIRGKVMNLFGCSPIFSESPPKRDHLLEYEPKAGDLQIRHMQDSFTKAVIPLSTDTNLQDRYVKYNGMVRAGRLLEDMDIFAVWVTCKHIKIPNYDPNKGLPYTIVTAMIDKIIFSDYTPIYNRDIFLTGYICWVGTSSVEVVVWLDQKDENNVMHKITRALFIMVTRNATNTKSIPTNPLEPTNDYEKNIASGALTRKNRRIVNKKESLVLKLPTLDEFQLIHSMFQKRLFKGSLQLDTQLPSKSKWLEDTIITNQVFTFPENRNAHNTLFGGHILSLAAQISFLCSYLHCKGERTQILVLCDVSFNESIAISSLIRLTSAVIYTHKNILQIVTIIDTYNSKKREFNVTNLIYFTYKSHKEVIQVYPKTYIHSMWYIEGKRKYKYAMEKVPFAPKDNT